MITIRITIIVIIIRANLRPHTGGALTALKFQRAQRESFSDLIKVAIAINTNNIIIIITTISFCINCLITSASESL